MSILIKGMEMPKDYSVIVKIFPDGRVGTIPYVQWFKVDLIPGTQAVPVPQHGRLIDADANLAVLMRVLDAPYTGHGTIETAMLKACIKVFEEAPTIIPAEEGE